MKRLPLALTAATVAALALAACTDEADTAADGVTGPVTIVVPNAPGGLADNSVRPIQRTLQTELGVDVVIENQPGAGGMVAANAVYNAEPDGNTLLAVVQPSAVLSDIYEDQSPAYQDFEFIGRLTGDDSMALAVRPDSDYTTVDDLVAAHESGTELLNATISGLNNQTLAEVVFTENTGVTFTAVPYEGGSESTRAVIDGVADVTFASLTSLVGPVEDGELEILTYFADEPIEAYAEYPHFATDYDGDGFTVGVGVVAPPDTADAILTQLRDALAVAANSEEYLELTSGSINAAYLDAEGWREQFDSLYDLVDTYSDVLASRG